jgi:hypothetical protein
VVTLTKFARTPCVVCYSVALDFVDRFNDRAERASFMPRSRRDL